MPNRPVWKPNATVAAIVEHQGRYLLLEERTEDGLRFNQPAGHLDLGESLADACVRETREETGLRVQLEALVGVYQWSPPARDGLCYLRFAFAAHVDDEDAVLQGVTIHSTNATQSVLTKAVSRPLDDGIECAVWLSYEEVQACSLRHRSPLVLQCIDDYRAGRRFPLDLIRHYD
jgi:ADP-ribose pyrophosphatase YjhB (NUDIX family)